MFATRSRLLNACDIVVRLAVQISTARRQIKMREMVRAGMETLVGRMTPGVWLLRIDAIDVPIANLLSSLI